MYIWHWAWLVVVYSVSRAHTVGHFFRAVVSMKVRSCLCVQVTISGVIKPCFVDIFFLSFSIAPPPNSLACQSALKAIFIIESWAGALIPSDVPRLTESIPSHRKVKCNYLFCLIVVASHLNDNDLCIPQHWQQVNMFPQGWLIALSISREELSEKQACTYTNTCRFFFDWAKIWRPLCVWWCFFKEMLNGAGLTLILCDLQLKWMHIMICLSIG